MLPEQWTGCCLLPAGSGSSCPDTKLLGLCAQGTSLASPLPPLLLRTGCPDRGIGPVPSEGPQAVCLVGLGGRAGALVQGRAQGARGLAGLTLNGVCSSSAGPTVAAGHRTDELTAGSTVWATKAATAQPGEQCREPHARTTTQARDWQAQPG